MREASPRVVIAIALARIDVAGAPIECVEPRIPVLAPVERLAAVSDDGAAVPSTPHDPVLVRRTLTHERVDDVRTRRASAFALDRFTAALERGMGPVVLVPLGLGVTWDSVAARKDAGSSRLSREGRRGGLMIRWGGPKRARKTS